MVWLLGALKWVRGIAKKIPWQIWVCAGVVVVTLGWGEFRHYQGKKEVREEWKASVERGKVLVDGLKAKQNQITERTIVKWREKVRTIYVKGDTITKLIPQYIPVDTPDLPGGFRVLHDAAATNTIPGPSTGADAEPVPVKDVAEIINFNYTLCHAERAKLNALWEWSQKQRKAYLELCKQPGVHCSTDN